MKKIVISIIALFSLFLCVCTPFCLNFQKINLKNQLYLQNDNNYFEVCVNPQKYQTTTINQSTKKTKTNVYGMSGASEFGEGADFIMLSLDFSSNGQIVQSIDFSLNNDWLNQNSKSVKENLDFKKNLTKQIETLRNEFLFSFALTYMNEPKEEYKINQGVMLTAVVFNEESQSVGFKIGFSSLGAWNYYHNAKENNTENDEKAEKINKNFNIFMQKVENKGIFPFSPLVKIQEEKKITAGERYKNIFVESAQGLSFYEKLKEDYHPVFVYNYSTFNTRLRSDATTTFIDNSRHLHHVWLIEENNLNNENTILIYYYNINRGAWLLFTLGICLEGMGISILIVKRKQHKNRDK